MKRSNLYSVRKSIFMENGFGLSNLEKKVLLVLKGFDNKADVPEIVAKSGLLESEVNRAVEWLLCEHVVCRGIGKDEIVP